MDDESGPWHFPREGAATGDVGWCCPPRSVGRAFPKLKHSPLGTTKSSDTSSPTTISRPSHHLRIAFDYSRHRIHSLTSHLREPLKQHGVVVRCRHVGHGRTGRESNFKQFRGHCPQSGDYRSDQKQDYPTQGGNALAQTENRQQEPKRPTGRSQLDRHVCEERWRAFHSRDCIARVHGQPRLISQHPAERRGQDEDTRPDSVLGYCRYRPFFSWLH